MRTNRWLEKQLELFLAGPFVDVEVKNVLSVKFGRKAKRRFGSIKMGRDKKESRITINGLFKNEHIPEEIIKATLAHELCHYVHGFSSPLKQKYKYPHQGGVIGHEMRKRGLYDLYNFEKIWTKKTWHRVVSENFTQTRKRVVIRRRKKTLLVKILENLVHP